MFSGHNYIGFTGSARGEKSVRTLSTAQQQDLAEAFFIANETGVKQATQKEAIAFEAYPNTNAEERALFLENISEEIVAIGDALIQRAAQETALPETRLAGERGRTVTQLKLFTSLDDISNYANAISVSSNKVGRVICNSVPTGVEVCHAIVHGGSYPATTDARTISVGPMPLSDLCGPFAFGIARKRFCPMH
jgi:acyl-CoA reductase-like NAD-dependent aldehyde dehydrogenase